MNYLILLNKYSLLLVQIILCIALPVLACAEQKTEISLHKYRGASPNSVAEAKFDSFRGILEQKILNLHREILQASQHNELDASDATYLDNLFISPSKQDNFTNTNHVYQWLNNQTNTLAILRGAIISDDNVNYMVFSQFYFHHLKDYLPLNVITVDLPIRSTEFGNTRDSHTVAILFALAIEAKQQEKDNSYIALILKTANDRLADIERRQGTLSADLMAIKEAILQVSTEILGEG